MDNRRYYKDPEYGDWVVITIGKNPERIWEDPAAMGLTKDSRISAPPNGNPDWWFTGRVWRREPARRMSWDREGIHAAIGFVMGLLIALAMLSGAWVNTMLAVNAIVLALFLAYEITEGIRIKDWAYRDIGGYLGGWLVPVVSVSLYLFESHWLGALEAARVMIIQAGG